MPGKVGIRLTTVTDTQRKSRVQTVLLPGPGQNSPVGSVTVCDRPLRLPTTNPVGILSTCDTVRSCLLEDPVVQAYLAAFRKVA
jgi:hypothetical protein